MTGKKDDLRSKRIPSAPEVSSRVAELVNSGRGSRVDLAVKCICRYREQSQTLHDRRPNVDSGAIQSTAGVSAGRLHDTLGARDSSGDRILRFPAARRGQSVDRDGLTAQRWAVEGPIAGCTTQDAVARLIWRWRVPNIQGYQKHFFVFVEQLWYLRLLIAAPKAVAAGNQIDAALGDMGDHFFFATKIHDYAQWQLWAAAQRERHDLIDPRYLSEEQLAYLRSLQGRIEDF